MLSKSSPFSSSSLSLALNDSTCPTGHDFSYELWTVITPYKIRPPLSASRPPGIAATSAALIDGFAIEAKASHEYSSIIFRIFITLISFV